VGGGRWGLEIYQLISHPNFS
jgi:hypothetical protein